jgi:hypothetical protein
MVVTAPPVAAFERPTSYREETIAQADAIRLLRIPSRRYLMIDGTDEPGATGFRDAIATLYPVAYTMHFALKRRDVLAPVGALEGLYWIDQPEPIPATSFATTSEAREHWAWRLMLPVPKQCTDADVQSAVEEVFARKRPPLLERLHCETWEEGCVAQILHIGPYADEARTVVRLQREIAERGLEMRGCHHEIYVSDPSRTAPDRLKTVIRQPVN